MRAAWLSRANPLPCLRSSEGGHGRTFGGVPAGMGSAGGRTRCPDGTRRADGTHGRSAAGAAVPLPASCAALPMRLATSALQSTRSSAAYNQQRWPWRAQ